MLHGKFDLHVPSNIHVLMADFAIHNIFYCSEYPVPPVDAENVAFFNGEIHVNMPESMVRNL